MNPFRVLKMAVNRHLRHYREWQAVLAEEGRTVSRWSMVRAVRSGGTSQRVWRRRMKICRRCPIYDRELRRCRGPVIGGVKPGCGCYVPFSAKTRRPYEDGCWGRTHLGYPFGWGVD
jgi:hypothetical protein